MVRIQRRLGVPPSARGSVGHITCPDIFELADGRIAVIGTDMTAELDTELPSDAGRAEYERIVVIPRETLLWATAAIPYKDVPGHIIRRRIHRLRRSRRPHVRCPYSAP